MEPGVDTPIGSLLDEKPTGVKEIIPTRRKGKGKVAPPRNPASPSGLILQGDCVELMHALSDESIRMVVTSPPYNIKTAPATA